MTDSALPSEIHDAAKAAWHGYLSLLDPLRPARHRYCRRLTGDLWEAEDLIQDTLLRGFAMLGSVHYEIANPRAYLLRIATNLWIDRQRRRALERAALSDPAAAATPPTADPERAASVRDAGTALLQYLAPQERAAVLLKDVFDLSLEECAQTIGTTPARSGCPRSCALKPRATGSRAFASTRSARTRCARSAQRSA
jgi:RNA polymerase sigma-70 factor (ECF subfamily)